jgi:hypothetical protein
MKVKALALLLQLLFVFPVSAFAQAPRWTSGEDEPEE